MLSKFHVSTEAFRKCYFYKWTHKNKMSKMENNTHGKHEVEYEKLNHNFNVSEILILM
jgi:hypothetical protein